MLFQEIKLFITYDIFSIGNNFLIQSKEQFKRLMKGMGENQMIVELGFDINLSSGIETERYSTL